MNFTVIGGEGFIGGKVVAHLRSDGQKVLVPDRNDQSILKSQLGHVIYAAGVTADFRKRPFDTMRAHVGLLAEILEHADFNSLLYLSSARIYRNAKSTHEESYIELRSEDPEDYYDFTKLAGEALCYASDRKNVRIARLANVIGSDFRSANFLFDLIRSACIEGHIELRSSIDSEKDYLLVSDVASVLPKIALFGKHRCYNVASGSNTSHSRILDAICATTGATFSVVPAAPRIIIPPIDIMRLQSEFGFAPKKFLSEIPKLVNEYRKIKNAEN